MERTFAWVTNFRRLNRDYERLAETLRALHISAHAFTLLTRAMRRLVYGVAVTDPATYAALALVLLGVVLLASWIPARRAARLDPTVVLRGD